MITAVIFFCICFYTILDTLGFQSVLFYIDTIYAALMVWVLFSILQIYTSIIFSLIMIGYFITVKYIYLNRSLQELTLKRRTKRQSHHLMLVILAQFRRSHILITCLVIKVNRTIFANPLCVFILTNIFSNVYIIGLILFSPPSFVDGTLFLLCILFQFAAIWINVIPMLSCNTHFARSRKYFPILQAMLPPTSIMAKVEHLSFYELLEKRLGFTLGPFGELTKWRVFKVRV